jgi:phosphatidylserine/phosphatidylglycerophosphate/cardiolipin synthase-like enzyme
MAAKTRIIPYKSDELDEDFRKHVIELFRNATKSITIITGEGSAFGYQDIRWALKEALDRGVKCRVYGNDPLYVSKWLSYGCKLYQGTEKAGDHFLVVDDHSFIHSFLHERKKIGVRVGEVHYLDAFNAKKIIKRFDLLVKHSKKLTFAEDPLVCVLKNPRDLGAVTKSSEIDDVVYS